MNLIYSLLLFALVYMALFCLLSKDKVKILVGLGLLGLTTNLFLFFSGGFDRRPAAFMNNTTAELSTDPLPQALILTAIVIGFGLLIFTAAVFNLVSDKDLKEKNREETVE